MRSPKQRIAEAIYNGTIGKPCIYVPDGFEAEVWHQRPDGEKGLSLSEAEDMMLIVVESKYFGHGWIHSNQRVWILSNSIHLWLNPVTTEE